MNGISALIRGDRCLSPPSEDTAEDIAVYKLRKRAVIRI